MKVTVKIGRTEGFVSSYNLFFENGLRLKTDSLLWVSKDEKENIRLQLAKIVDMLRSAGCDIKGEL